MGVELVHLPAHCSHVLSYLNPSVINGTVYVGTEHIHSHTSLAAHTLVPQILVLCLEAFKLEQFGHLDL